MCPKHRQKQYGHEDAIYVPVAHARAADSAGNRMLVVMSLFGRVMKLWEIDVDRVVWLRYFEIFKLNALEDTARFTDYQSDVISDGAIRQCLVFL